MIDGLWESPIRDSFNDRDISVVIVVHRGVGAWRGVF
jgi:hypothetical protein